MVNKVYIVVNEEQEQEVLDKVYKKGKMWPRSPDRKGNYWSPVYGYIKFPYVITDNGERLNWTNIEMLTDEEIVFDGRKEEQMSDKYVVSREFMNKLDGWKIDYVVNSDFLDIDNIGNLPPIVSRWWIYADITDKERNNRLIAIIRWVNGEDVFQVEKPKKWVVRSKEMDEDGDYGYVLVGTHGISTTSYNIGRATHFDTKEEAQEWANSHQEVIEV